MSEALYRRTDSQEIVTTPAEGYASGQIVVAPSGKFGVVEGLRALEENEAATLVTRGQFDIAAASATTFAAGATVYFNETTRLAVTAAGAGIITAGVATVAKIAGQLSVLTLINP